MTTLSPGAASALGAGQALGLWLRRLLALSFCAWAAGALSAEDPAGEIQVGLSASS